MTQPDLTVIVVNWNGRGILADCLRSVFAEDSGIALEVIAVDNGSTDGSVDMVRDDFPRTNLIANERNLGFAAANNQAMAIARGRHVLLLNSDTIVHGRVLGETVRFLDARPEVGAMACRVLNRDGTEQQVARPAPHWWRLWMWAFGAERLAGRADVGHPSRDPLVAERDVGFVAGCYLAVPAETIAAVGRLDEHFYFFGEDADWCERIRRSGRQVVQAPVGDITHLGGASSEAHSHRRDLMLSYGLAVFNRKFHGRVGALLAAGAIWTYYLSRWMLLVAMTAFRRDERLRIRRDRFRRILGDFGSVWTTAWRGRFGAPTTSARSSTA